MKQPTTTQRLTRRTFLLLAGTMFVAACGATVSGNPASQPSATAAPAQAATPTSAQAASTPATSAQTALSQPATTQVPPVQTQAVAMETPTTTQALPGQAQPTATTAVTATVPVAATTQATPACTAGAVTPSQTEGPYYKANPPQQPSLLQPGINGSKLVVTGFVLGKNCQPIAGARVDFWQADAGGQYDNSGYTLRGYQLTDASGRYSVTTVVPGLYPGRTRHIHVKVSPPSGPVLTTQLYFPGEAANSRDSIFDARLILDIQKTADGEAATFNFVLPAA
jgi:protocatechuate 3,4-dioxygenase beta subunit